MSTIKYPNGISTINTMQSKSYSSRGMRLENDINDSNKYYRELDKALIYKKPTPVQVVHVDYPKRQRAKITEAYYKTPSTTDYNGVYRGKYIDFEAKETKNKTSFPLFMIHPHPPTGFLPPDMPSPSLPREARKRYCREVFALRGFLKNIPLLTVEFPFDGVLFALL